MGAADSRLLDSPLGLAGHQVLATLWFGAGSPLPSRARGAARRGPRNHRGRSPRATAGTTSPHAERRRAARSRRSRRAGHGLLKRAGMRGGRSPGSCRRTRRASGRPDPVRPDSLGTHRMIDSTFPSGTALAVRIRPAMELTPREKDKLLLFTAALLAERGARAASSSTIPRRSRSSPPRSSKARATAAPWPS